MKTLEDLRDELGNYARVSSEYYDKMIHAIPEAPQLVRETFIESWVRGKVVLNLGCASGGLQGRIKAVAKTVVGVDKQQPADLVVDLDENPEAILPTHLYQVECVVMGEILEHLGNPGNLLKSLRILKCPILITVPNAFASAGHIHVKADGYENVNRDHVAWYSWKTLKTLVERYGFEFELVGWYGGKPRVAEGLIAIAR